MNIIIYLKYISAGRNFLKTLTTILHNNFKGLKLYFEHYQYINNNKLKQIRLYI